MEEDTKGVVFDGSSRERSTGTSGARDVVGRGACVEEEWVGGGPRTSVGAVGARVVEGAVREDQGPEEKAGGVTYRGVIDSASPFSDVSVVSHYELRWRSDDKLTHSPRGSVCRTESRSPKKYRGRSMSEEQKFTDE